MIVTSAKTCVAPVATSRVGGIRAAGTKSTMRPSLARVTLSRRASAVAVSAGKKAPEMPPIVSPTDGTPEWFACVACADFYFNDIQNEALAERMRAAGAGDVRYDALTLGVATLYVGTK